MSLAALHVRPVSESSPTFAVHIVTSCPTPLLVVIKLPMYLNPLNNFNHIERAQIQVPPFLKKELALLIPEYQNPQAVWRELNALNTFTR